MAIFKKLNSIFCWFKAKKIRIIDIVFVVCLLFSYIVFKVLSTNLLLDFSFNLNIESGYSSFMNGESDLYVVESSKHRALKIKNHEVVWAIGEQEDKPFDQIESIAVDDDSANVYVHGLNWDDDSGYLVKEETINKYNSHGQYLKTIYKVDYHGAVERKNKLFNLRVANGKVEFIRADDLGFEYVSLINEDEDKSEQYYENEDYEKSEESDEDKIMVKAKYEFDDAIDLIKNYSVSSKTGNIYAVDKRGKILVADGQGVSTYQELGANVYPNDVAVGSDESIYFTDLKTSSVNRIYSNHHVEEVFSKKDLYPIKACFIA